MEKVGLLVCNCLSDHSTSQLNAKYLVEYPHALYSTLTKSVCCVFSVPYCGKIADITLLLYQLLY